MREHCCDDMRAHLEVGDVPAALAAAGRHVVYDAVFDEYSLVRDGGLDTAPITHCPWCGDILPASRREEWFLEVQRRGLSPDDPTLDERYRTDAWWSDVARPMRPPPLGDDGLL
jgi:hypothetical protein